MLCLGSVWSKNHEEYMGSIVYQINGHIHSNSVESVAKFKLYHDKVAYKLALGKQIFST